MRFLDGVSVKKVQSVVEEKDIIMMQEEVGQVLIKEPLVEYVVKLMNETRKNENISLGASPRAMLALIRAARAKAYISGRNYVIPDDILVMIEPVLAHRIVISTEAQLNKMTATKILKSIVSTMRIPY